ncbi:patatin-like phospholipase family protein [Microvirga puerhi]|uniref:Patatin-like phospholipase family protein n=1 Tax=Microvirga puerhi TaxID=2876078 RepID=A0ABS7VQ48_9HYPH|nr:patatin-like phospholipase family protein [Microvirga puerhi]MBZ6077683.1 patatin-like phospholipase family protein [Microvirga puerhi]
MADAAIDPGRVATPETLLDCDVVMAGGVTSGIIYPGAIAVIARRYSFHSIGGTSVGAIAAAVTAAAEYGRRTGANPKAFEQVGALPKSLGDTAEDGHSRLFHLFTPEPQTKPLLALVTPLFGGGGPLRQAARIFKVSLSTWQVAVSMAAIAAIALATLVALAAAGRPVLLIVCLIAFLALLLLVWLTMLAVVLARRWLPAWRRNGYGICTGNWSPQNGADAAQLGLQGLTPWMNRVVQAAAGRAETDPPLTFGDLWSAGQGGATTEVAADPTAPRAIDLAMIASDISRHRIVQLPFLESPSPLYAEVSVLERYFPPSVVDWMKARAGDYDPRVEVRPRVIRLPKPQDLPVIFGARLSLSFPVLLSAVPLLTPDFARPKDSNGLLRLRRVWFSDGGLVSNFPIHFFDSPIPSRPTFCFNLVSFDAEVPNVEWPDDEGRDQDGGVPKVDIREAEKPIAQPRAPAREAASRPKAQPSGDPQPGDPVWGFISMTKGNRFSPVPFTAFDTAHGTGIAPFFQTLLNTARFWSDNQMLIAPGVRDRVVNIALRDDEGGLNLDMSPKVIADLDRRGCAAGLLISARFDPQAQQDPETGETNEEIFANHRWVRYRNFMAAFEDLSRRFARSRRTSDKAALVRDESLLDDMIAGKAKEKLGYPAPRAAQPYFQSATDDFERLALKMAAATRVDPNATFDRPRSPGLAQGRQQAGAAPRPKMRARLRPLINNDPREEIAELPDPSEV